MVLPPLPPITFNAALESIVARAQKYDISTDWPLADLAQLQSAGVMRWVVPRSHGGEELSPYNLHLRYEQIASASVSTSLILTQRDAAVGLIDGATSFAERDNLLNRLAKNEMWATVGIAQLTTSRQGGAPAVRAQRIDGGYIIDGTIPWCTGAHRSSHIVGGATLADGKQILFVLQQSQEGVSLDPPMQMVALTNTLTSSIRLQQVMIADNWVMRGPTDNALASGRKGLALGQTFIATGLTQGALNLIAKHDSNRARAAHDRFTLQLRELRSEIAGLCQPGREADATSANARLRGACNELALRVTHAAIALYKGTALLLDHPAQRLAREAMFLLVWSCPNPVIDCTLDLLSEAGH